MGRDATQPRVTVRPKPPVLLGATSETNRRHRFGIVSDNPNPGLVRWLQGSHHSVTRHACCRKLLPAPAASSSRNSMPTLDPALRLSLGHLSVHLAALLPASLRPALRLSVGVRRAFISELGTPCASCRRRSMRFREIQMFSPPFPRSSPMGPRESPTHPHEGGTTAFGHLQRGQLLAVGIDRGGEAAQKTRPVARCHVAACLEARRGAGDGRIRSVCCLRGRRPASGTADRTGA